MMKKAMFPLKSLVLRRKYLQIIVFVFIIYALFAWILWPAKNMRIFPDFLPDDGTNYQFHRLQRNLKERLLGSSYSFEDMSKQESIEIESPDQPFLNGKNMTYDDSELVYWEPAPKVPLNASEPGHLGVPTSVPFKLKPSAWYLYFKYRVNTYASDLVPFNRTLRDFRYPTCLRKTYPRKLPQTTVIIIFCDETWSTLIRTVWSVYSRSPRELLKEIILVDDNSSFDYLRKQLDDYIGKIPVKIRILRLEKRVGLTVAKQRGAELATTPTITFLDAHCECNEGWLEPMLTTIARNRHVLVAPMIETLNAWTLGYNCYTSEDVVGSFDWNLVFHWLNVPQRERVRVNWDATANLRSPEFAGGVFMMDRQYFHDLGGYDRGMEFYGAENIEMSLRIWMSGGRVENVPCSRVAHVERYYKPYQIPGGLERIVVKNTARVVNVWFDEYKELYYGLHPEALEFQKTVNVSERVELRKRLRSRSFKWYLENIFPESVYARKYIGAGFIESAANKGSCIDTYSRTDLTARIYGCHFDQSAHQTFIVTEKGEIVIDTVCLTVGEENRPLRYDECVHHSLDEPNEKQKFIYDKAAGTFKYQNGTKCIALNGGDVILSTCNGSPEQKWIIRNMYTANLK